MDIQGISAMAKSQTNYESQNQAAADSSSSGGWKYLTVKEGGRVYTYLVIGKNMRILIGESSEEKTDNKDQQAADTTKASNQETGRKQAAENDGVGGVGKTTNGQKEQQTDFLLNTEMLALTGYYQEQMRRTIRQVAEAVGNSSDKVETVENGQAPSFDHR